MTPELLDYLCEPLTFLGLHLQNAVKDERGHILSGDLVAASGRSYPIIDGVPRFIENGDLQSVQSFGDEWNAFDFVQWKTNWLAHTVANTFGSPEAFAGKLIVDCGGGSGAQSKWFAELGARHVVTLELSHSVDGVMRRNVGNLDNVDVIQCSIDAPPLRPGSIDGIVYCHNVIQHTPSVEGTARALYALVASGGEFVFNCYQTNDAGPMRWMRHHLIYRPLRAVLSRSPFQVIKTYAILMGHLRAVPLLGDLLELSGICARGEVVPIAGESKRDYQRRCFDATRLNTFDKYGSHSFQHQKSDSEIRSLVHELQPNPDKVLNTDRYFLRPMPIGCALRVMA
jgi:SAM-dependent methyltransferase